MARKYLRPIRFPIAAEPGKGDCALRGITINIAHAGYETAGRRPASTCCPPSGSGQCPPGAGGEPRWTRPVLELLDAAFRATRYGLTKEEGGRPTPFVANYRPRFFCR